MTDSNAASVVEQEQPAAAPPAAPAAAEAAPDAAERSASRKRVAKPDDAASTERALSAASGAERLDLLSNIEMDVTAELGRTRMPVRQLLALTPGMVVELDKMAGSPIDLLVNGTLIARGEVVVIDEEFGIRISEIVSPSNEVAR